MPGRDDTSAVFSGVMENTPVGPIAVWATRNGVRRVGYVQQDMIDEGHWDPAGDETLALAFEQLGEYLEGCRKSFDLPLDFSGATPFQRRIFERLIYIPHGRIVSYGDIADELGDPGAARAVGQAVGANPLPIVVPCHRVVRSDGKLGGYSGGLQRKITLLGIEGVDVDGPRPGSRVHPEVLRLPF
jgi:methylated-DNA-[protein]-cysteine S-methyltransferase